MTPSAGVGPSKFEPRDLVKYSIDTKTSSCRVHAFAGGLISGLAHSPKFELRDWQAETHLCPDNLTSGTFTAHVSPQNLVLIDEVSEHDRREIFRIMHSEVLETEKYPEIAFNAQWKVASQMGEFQYKVGVEGGLLLHGVTNPLRFDAIVTLSPDTFRAHGEFVVLQNEHRMKVASIGGSTLFLRNELVFNFFVIGRRS